MIFTVRGIVRSELRATFCATRFTYSLITGSVMIFAEWSISVAICLPYAISFSWEMMLLCATLRLPTSSTSFFLLSAPERTCANEKSSATSRPALSAANGKPALRVVFMGLLLHRPAFDYTSDQRRKTVNSDDDPGCQNRPQLARWPLNETIP